MPPPSEQTRDIEPGRGHGAVFADRFAGFIRRLAGNEPDDIFAVARFLAARSLEGHVCISLRQLSDSMFDNRVNGEAIRVPSDAEKWRVLLQSSPVVGGPGDFRPMILDEDRVYLHRFWKFEETVADAITSRAEKVTGGLSFDSLGALLERIFPGEDADTDWRRVAAYIAATRRFCAIAGGPGTGKTTTVAGIVALLAMLCECPPLRVVITAPTGKAAARLQQVISSRISQLTDREHQPAVSGGTIHRLLGARPGARRPRHHEQNPLQADLLVVDEASMADLPLAAMLVSALPPGCRLILLGDHNQLASVQAGSLYGDVCSGPKELSGFSSGFREELVSLSVTSVADINIIESPPAIADCTVELRKVYRFNRHIAALSNRIRSGDVEAVCSGLDKQDAPHVTWTKPASESPLTGQLELDIREGWDAYLRAESIEEMFEAFGNFRVLCGVRSGPFGVDSLNRAIERLLGLTEHAGPRHGRYHRRPVIITQNDYNLGLYNGDTGIMATGHRGTGSTDGVAAWFPAPSCEHGNTGTFRAISPVRLPSHETAFATTVHKSQGSEFGSVLLLLPNIDNPVLTRELVYTAVTRARDRVHICSTEEVLRAALGRATERKSGLGKKLRG